MANALQLRRGTTTEHGSFTGLAGEITVDTTKDTIVVHDGSTQGGIPLAKESAISTNATTLGGQSLSQIQTAYEAYTDTEVAALVASAPATLDTLNELAAALGDDPNFATTVTNSIATKLPLAGGTMTGNVTYNDNVKAQFGAGNDLQIYHDGSHSYIAETGTGNLIIRASNLQIANSSGTQYLLVSNDGGGTYLYHNGTNRLETTNYGVDVAGTLQAEKVQVDGTLDIEEVYEKVVLDGGTSGTITFDTTAQGIAYFVNNQTANRTINFSNVGANLSTGQSLTCTLLCDQGSSAYYLNAYQIDGNSVTPRWSGGSAPTGGNASGIDVYTFTIIRTGSSTYTVLASQTQFA